MSSLGLTEILLILALLVFSMAPLVGCILGTLAFFKYRKIEIALKEKGIL